MKELKDLNPGDYVVVSWVNRRSELVPIESITPSGLIKLLGHYFYPTGREKTSDIWNFGRIRVATEQDIAYYKTRDDANRMRRLIMGYVANTENFVKIKEIFEIVKGEIK